MQQGKIELALIYDDPDERWNFVHSVLAQRRDNPSDDDFNWISIEDATSKIVDAWETELYER